MTLPSPDLTRKAETIYKKIRAMAEAADDVLGFFLTGSRGKGRATPFSDYDCYLIVPDDAARQKYMDLLAEFDVRTLTLLPKEGVDMHIYSMDEFRNFASWRGWGDWDAYSFARLKVDIDRTGGEIQRLIDEKAVIPESEAAGVARQAIHDYMNQVYRSLKALRDGNYVGHRLEAALSVNFLFDALFCIHGRRRRPWYKYLVWEIEIQGFTRLPMSDRELLEKILTILTTADYKTQIELYGITARFFRAMGYGDRADYWDGPVEQAMAGLAMVDISKVVPVPPFREAEREAELKAKIESLAVEVSELEKAMGELRGENGKLRGENARLQQLLDDDEPIKRGLVEKSAEVERLSDRLRETDILMAKLKELEEANERLREWRKSILTTRSHKIAHRVSCLYALVLRWMGKKPRRRPV